ncbi:MAG: HAMP domain-containing sensor histidine kinase [Flavobacteriaceae bacterium]
MNEQRSKTILFYIASVILVTLCIQVYWNYKNYQTGKQQLVNDVQTSLDNAVEQYYTQLATKHSLRFISDSISFSSGKPLDYMPIGIDSLVKIKQQFNLDSLTEGLTLIKSHFKDSIGINIAFNDTLAHDARFLSFSDSLNNPIEILSSKIIVSFKEDELSLKKIDRLFSEELQRKNIPLEYGLSTTNPLGKSETLRPEIIENASLKTQSKSPFFLHGNTLSLHFTNSIFSVLKRNLLGIFLSFILVGGVMASLLYLLKIITKQKQLAELKNDLISNLTHEFKTPIATIGVALESIQNFNKENNPEKTLRYTKISRDQIEKLNVMVEKLLETATLDSEALQLKLEPCNVVHLLGKVLQKEAFFKKEKQLTFWSSEEEVILNLDVFHFENALNNIIDNALKYGGDTIEVTLQKKENNVLITISDSGNSLDETHKKQIFEKFYRVPKGNTHDVKGFGIGLYYTQKIIEKHHGSIELIPQPQTTFKISFPNG